tara:strand:+ start:1571 stop:1768 length:198 start_codon:yes stop_codon:yes gene_type:complete
MNWNKLLIEPTTDMTDEDVQDFLEWVYRKAERLGFTVKLQTPQETESGSSDIVSTNPLEKTNETY